jgi:hypothetical protein
VVGPPGLRCPLMARPSQPSAPAASQEAGQRWWRLPGLNCWPCPTGDLSLLHWISCLLPIHGTVIRHAPFKPWALFTAMLCHSGAVALVQVMRLSMFHRVHSARKPEMEPVQLAAAAAGSELLPAHHPAALAVALAAGNTGHVSAAVRAAMRSSQVSWRLCSTGADG